MGSGMIGGGMGLTGSIIDTAFNVANAQKQMQFSSDWAYRQRDWALQDWNMMNEYNAPKNQRQRLIDAKINPAIMYGQGAGAGLSSPVRSSPSAEFTPIRTNFGLMMQQALDTYMGIKLKEAQIKNLETNATLNIDKSATQRATTSLTWSKEKFTETQNNKLQSYVDALTEYAHENSIKTSDGTGEVLGNYYKDQMQLQTKTSQQNLSIQEQENVRRMVRNSASIEQIIAETAMLRAKTEQIPVTTEYIKQQTELLKKSGILKDLDIEANQDLHKNFTGIIGIIIRRMLGGK